jgi:putative addiction module component (TIGR02574 family)
MTTVAQIMSEVLELPRSDRSYLASKLIESLDDEQDLSPEWKTEIGRRVERRKSGEASQISQDELHRDIGKILAR